MLFCCVVVEDMVYVCSNFIHFTKLQLQNSLLNLAVSSRFKPNLPCERSRVRPRKTLLAAWIVRMWSAYMILHLLNGFSKPFSFSFSESGLDLKNGVNFWWVVCASGYLTQLSDRVISFDCFSFHCCRNSHRLILFWRVVASTCKILSWWAFNGCYDVLCLHQLFRQTLMKI